MRLSQGILLVVLLVFFFFSCSGGRVQKGNGSDIDQKVDSILSLMTLEEKAGQMLNLGLPALLTGEFYSTRDTLVYDEQKIHSLLLKSGAGSVQNKGNFPLTPEEWHHYIGYIQKVIQDSSRLKIPVLYGIDAVHGANYTAGSVLFPQQINLAATFNTACAHKVGEITAYEMKASATPWNYSPNLDVSRNPLWGRIYETFGEDTYTVSEMGKAMMQGMQGDDPSAYTNVLAGGKHFLGYGAPHNGKDRAPVYMPERMIRQVLLPPFKAAIDKGLLTVMLSSGSLNGVPCHANKWLVTDILKGELGFKGVVISDWGDIDNLVTVHQVARNEREAVKLAVNAGLDICMEPYDKSFVDHLVDLVKKGEVPQERVDDAVRRILYLKFKSGVFYDPLFEQYNYEEFASKESHQANLEIAKESLTLLKNKGDFLPLQKEKKILVAGVSANSLNYLNGGWSRTWAGENPQYNDKEKQTILEAVQEEVGKENVLYAPGTSYLEDIDINDAVQKARQADLIIACIGEKPATEKPSDIENLDLPGVQVKLVKELAKTGKPIVLVMVQGRPRIIREIEQLSDAIIMAYLPGNEGGRAISDLIFGKYSPSGRLPFTYPKFSGSLWTYDHPLSDERDIDFGLNGFNPQYEFGYGLSYTTFEYGELKLSADTIAPEDDFTVQVEITNTGDMAGKESVLLFVRDEVASIAPNVKQLKRFRKIELGPKEQTEVSFTLSVKDLEFVGNENTWMSEPGYFTFSVGDKKQRIYLKL